MKNLVVLILVIGAAIFAYNYFSTPLTEQEQMVKNLEDEFDNAKKQMASAARTSSLTGMDTTGGAGNAVDRVKKIQIKLDVLLLNTLTEETAIQRAEALEGAIKRWLDKME
jgi:transcriptional regulator of met regulon